MFVKALLCRYYGWTYDDFEKLTPRLARNYLAQIPDIEKTFSGEGKQSTPQTQSPPTPDEMAALAIIPPR